MNRLNKIILIIALHLSFGLNAQIETNELPQSFFENGNKSQADVVKLSQPDLKALSKQDELEDQIKDMPWRFGIEEAVNINIHEDGTWKTQTNGSLLWQLDIQADYAKSINLNFSKFKLPGTAKFFISNADYTDILGALTSSNNKEDGHFATRPVRGDLIHLELTVSSSEKEDIEFITSGIVYGYRDVFEKTRKTFGSSGNCNVNINCNEGEFWQDIKRSIVLITRSNNTRLCTGTLLNNVRQDSIPYILTASHCGLQTSSVFIFNYESPNCSPNADGSLAHSVSGASSKAINTNSDFHLFELSSSIPSSYNVYYAGWDATNRIPEQTTGIHHPSSDVMKISHDYDSPITSGYYTLNGTSHWMVLDWDVGTTEGGSSGSALFDEYQRVIGQLEGGNAACGNDLEDYYGKFAVSWNGSGSSTNSLKHWLDPDNTGTLSINGMLSAAPSNQWDFASIFLKKPSDLSCNLDSIETYLLLKNYSDITVNTLRILYEFNGVLDSVNWNGSSTYPDIFKIDFPKLKPINGTNTLLITKIKGANPYSTTNSSNDSLGFEFIAVQNPISVIVTLKTDDYGDETSWEVQSNSSNPTQYYSGGPYPRVSGGRTYRDTICLYDSCFNFVLKDSYGDGFNDPSGSNGNGFLLLTDTNGDTLAFENDFRTSSKSIPFCLNLSTSITERKSDDNIFNIYPNPLNKGEDLYFDSNEKGTRVLIYDYNGRLVLEKILEKDQISDSSLNLNSGLYLIEILDQKGDVLGRKKLIVTE